MDRAVTYTRAQFRADLKALGLSREEFAERYGYAVRSLAEWGGRDRPFPAWVPDLLAAQIALKQAKEPQLAFRDAWRGLFQETPSDFLPHRKGA